MSIIDPRKNYEETREEIGYVARKKATLNDYKRIGFKSGLEVHQQLLTRNKLFCRCPAGIYHDDNDFDAEVIRHMRPTLSEMGVYDGTALMEFRTRKEITYRINNETACTYEIDDTPPFPVDRDALEIAISIALAARMNIVGEVHITRKQYLDGSIPAGFQRSAIISMNGELQLKSRKVRLIQLSLEEDACREVSDIGHKRIFKTDRLGMPLIEIVTCPDCLTPDELAEAAEYIRFLNRSTGKVRTGMGAAREDVNVSCEGGNRVEIKGVAHIRWIPELSHNEAFRQYSLLNIRSKLLKRIKDPAAWSVKTKEITERDQEFHFAPVRSAIDDRLKVIACIEKPNMTHSEETSGGNFNNLFPELAIWLSADAGDAQIIIWGPDEDIPTAIETVEERIRLAFGGVPRMYPDTDSQPIAVTTEMLEKLSRNIPVEISERFIQMKEWNLPEDTWHYLLSKNLVVLIERISNDFGFDPKEIGILTGHRFRSLEGRGRVAAGFSYERLYDLFAFLKNEKLLTPVARIMLPAAVAVASPDFRSILAGTGLRRATMNEIREEAKELSARFPEICHNRNMAGMEEWIMGQLHLKALGTVKLSEVRNMVTELLEAGD